MTPIHPLARPPARVTAAVIALYVTIQLCGVAATFRLRYSQAKACAYHFSPPVTEGLHSDHLGGVNAVTDSAGTVVAKADYMPFGDVKQGSTGNEKYSYTGKEKDKTDLYYFESRYNSPMFRHFTQSDTVAPDLSDPQDLNRYSYVGNNPLSYVDYDGHKKKKKSKKKAKLSKREKYMIAHGIDPDKDKTPLKEAKKKYGENNSQQTYELVQNIEVNKSRDNSVSNNKIPVQNMPEGASSNTSIENSYLYDNKNMYQSDNKNSTTNANNKVAYTCEGAVSSIYHSKDSLRDKILCLSLPFPTLGTSTVVKAGAETVGTNLGYPGVVTGGLAVFGVSL